MSVIWECTGCHVADRWDSDELKTKVTARRHFQMQANLNRDVFGGQNAIT